MQVDALSQPACAGLSLHPSSCRPCSQALPIPELIPFRLTRQLVNALQPLPALDLLAPSMAALLAAMQAPLARQVRGPALSCCLAWRPQAATYR